MVNLRKHFLARLAKARQAKEKLESAAVVNQVASTATQPVQQNPPTQLQHPAISQQQPPYPQQAVITQAPQAEGPITRIKLPAEPGAVTKGKEDLTQALRNVNESYSLISTQFNNQTYNLAYARIQYNPNIHQLEYFIVEPEINDHMKKIIGRTKEELHEKLDVDLNHLRARNEVYKYINDKIDEIWAGIGLVLSPEDTVKLKYYIMRDTIGLNEIEPLMQDPNIEDIGCDGTGLPIFIFHRNPLYGDITTNVKYATEPDLDSFVMKLAQKCGRTISVASPLMDGTLPDGSRVQITYGTDIARKGSNFTIRKFFKVPLTPIDLMNFGTIDAMALAYLWFAIEKEKSILISGTTATGKTTLLNAVSLFIPPASKIVSIEDTAELQLTHKNWVPQITRAATGQESYGEISMYTLLKSALRQRPDYLIVGEVRGAEASVLFQAMATGHASLSTLHADTIDAVIHRLTNKPIDLPLAALDNLDIIVFLDKAKKEGKFKRRVSKILEIEGFDYAGHRIKSNPILTWSPRDDTFTTHDSSMLHSVAERLGWTDQEIQEEVVRRANVLTWLKEKGIYKFQDVAKIVQMYYADPKQLESLMGAR